MSVRVVRGVPCPACWRNGPPSDVGRVDMTGICWVVTKYGTRLRASSLTPAVTVRNR